MQLVNLSVRAHCFVLFYFPIPKFDIHFPWESGVMLKSTKSLILKVFFVPWIIIMYVLYAAATQNHIYIRVSVAMAPILIPLHFVFVNM